MIQSNKIGVVSMIKKIGKLTQAFILMAIIIFISGCTKNDNELILVTEAGFSPYEYYQDGKIVGVDIDIANEIAKRLNKKLVIKDISFDFLINEIKSGKADFAAAGISITDERKKEVDFTDEYTISNQVVVIRKDSTITSFNDIKTKRIVAQLGTVADLYVTKNYKQATLVTHKKYLSAVEDVKSKKADCLIMDELPAREIIKENQELKIMDGILFQDKYGMIVKRGNTKLKEDINKILKEMNEDGTIEKLILKHSK